MDHLNLSSYIIDRDVMVSCAIEITLDGLTVGLHRPFVPVGAALAVTPAVTADGQGLRISLDRWIPMYHGGDRIVFLPLQMATQAAAVAALRAFTDDPAIAWTASHTELLAWAQTWITLNRIPKES